MQKIISEHAAMLRLNRHLAKVGMKVCRSRFIPALSGYGELGRFYVVKTDGFVEARDIDLVQWMREDSLLKPWEYVEGTTEESAN